MISAITLHKSSGETIHLQRPRPAQALPFVGWLTLAAVASLTDFGWYWLSWIIAGFVVPELYTVLRGVANGPLSNNVWLWEHLDVGHPFQFATWTPMHWGLAIITWGLFGWLSIHFPFGLLR